MFHLMIFGFGGDNCHQYVSGVRFLKDGRILIPRVHEKILVGLPISFTDVAFLRHCNPYKSAKLELSRNRS